MHTLNVRIPDEIGNRLSQLAAETGRTKSYYVRELICEHLEELEDVYLAEQALLRFRQGGEQAIPLDEVKKRLGL